MKSSLSLTHQPLTSHHSYGFEEADLRAVMESASEDSTEARQKFKMLLKALYIGDSMGDVRRTLEKDFHAENELLSSASANHLISRCREVAPVFRLHCPVASFRIRIQNYPNPLRYLRRSGTMRCKQIQAKILNLL